MYSDFLYKQLQPNGYYACIFKPGTHCKVNTVLAVRFTVKAVQDGAWFLEIVFVQYVCMFVCVCPPGY